jgi:ABC-2 type transport system ATP-binding protein
MSSATPASLETADLTKCFGALVAVDGLNLALQPGTVTGFLGPNGAGKSTTIRMVVGLTRPTRGSVNLFGRPALDPDARQALGYLPADAAFDPRLSGTENLDILASLRGSNGSADRGMVAESLGFSAADARRPVKELSSGMRQKLGLVAAMQHRPDLIVLDEPANRLDPLVHQAFCDLVRRLAAVGRTILLSSHVLGEVEKVCDRVALIRTGRLIEVAEVATIRNRAQRRVTLRYADPHPPPDVLTDPEITGTTVVGRLPGGRPDLIRYLLDDPAVVDIEVEPPSLEDVFLEFYTDRGSDAHADQG